MLTYHAKDFHNERKIGLQVHKLHHIGYFDVTIPTVYDRRFSRRHHLGHDHLTFVTNDYDEIVALAYESEVLKFKKKQFQTSELR